MCVDPFNFWVKYYKRNDPNQDRDLWYFTQQHLYGTSNLLYVPNEMYSKVEPKSNIEYKNIDEICQYKTIPKISPDSEVIHNWFILSSLPGLNIEYYFKKIISSTNRYYKFTFDFNFIKNLNKSVVIYWKHFILYNYEEYKSVGTFLQLQEKYSNRAHIEVSNTLYLNDEDVANIRTQTLNNLNLELKTCPKSNAYNNLKQKNLVTQGNINVRVFSYFYLKGAKGEDLAHVVADVDYFSI